MAKADWGLLLLVIGILMAVAGSNDDSNSGAGCGIAFLGALLAIMGLGMLL